MPSPAVPPQRQPFSWAKTAGLLASMILPIVAALNIWDGTVVPAAVAGAVLGLMGTLLGNTERASLAGVLVVALYGLRLIWPDLDLRIIGVVLAFAAGAEAAKTGGRSFTVSMMALGLLVASSSAGAPLANSLIAFLGALMVALVCARLMGLHTLPVAPPEGLRPGIRQALFLALGLLIMVPVARALDSPHSIWVIQFFVLRGLAPGHATARSSLKFLAGVLIGTALAVALEFAGLNNPPWSYMISAIAAVTGLRLLPYGPPFVPAAFTVALLLTMAPSPNEALFRSEAALVSVALAIALSFGLSRLIRNPKATNGQ